MVTQRRVACALIVLTCTTSLRVSNGAVLQGHWTLDELSGPTANDESSFNRDGTYVTSANGPVFGQAGAFFNTGTSVGFVGGEGDEVNIGDDFNAFTNDFTIALWMRPTSQAELDGGADRRAFSSGSNAFGMGLRGKKLIFTTYNVQDYISSADYFPTANAWKHVAVVFDASNDASFYVNGVFVETIAGAAPASPGVSDFFIGSRSGPGSDWHGTLDDVRFYSGALTSAEILALAVPEPVGAASFGLLGVMVLSRRVRRLA